VLTNASKASVSNQRLQRTGLRLPLSRKLFGAL
jgi:hypothetical protein